MPYERPEVPPNTRCLAKNCQHLFTSHNDSGECDLCACSRIDLPGAYKPRWIKDENVGLGSTWLCTECFYKVFPEHQQIGMTSRLPMLCEVCSQLQICIVIDTKKVEEEVDGFVKEDRRSVPNDGTESQNSSGDDSKSGPHAGNIYLSKRLA